MKATVIAAGSWGTALAKVLCENGHCVSMWVRRPEQAHALMTAHENVRYLPGVTLPDALEVTSNLNGALEGSTLLVFAVPAQQYRDTLALVLKSSALSEGAIFVNVAKGIDVQTLETLSQATERICPERTYVVLSGPSHAEEVGRRLPTALVSASRHMEAAQVVQNAFSNAYLRVYTHPDVVGVEISAALKNIIALGAGISDGLGFGDNAKAALMTRGLHEIARLGVRMGARADTFRGLAGAGDLIVTCTSMHSRNRRCGMLLGEGKSLSEATQAVGMVVEGAYTVQAANALRQRLHIEMPIVEALYGILYESRDAREVVTALMARRRKHEMDDAIDAEEEWV